MSSGPPALPHTAKRQPSGSTTPQNRSTGGPSQQTAESKALDELIDEVDIDGDDDSPATPGNIPPLAVKDEGVVTPKRDPKVLQTATPAEVLTPSEVVVKPAGDTPRIMGVDGEDYDSDDGSNASIYSATQQAAEAANLDAKHLFDTKLRTLVPEFDPASKRRNISTLLLATLTIFLGITQIEVDHHNQVSHEVNNILRACNSALTLVLILFIVQYRLFLLKIERKQWNLESPLPLLESGQALPLLAEVLICIVHAPPFIRYRRDIDPSDPCFIDSSLECRRGPEDVADRLTMWMFLRWYLVGRVLRDYSQVFLSRKKILQEKIKSKMGDEVNKFSWWLTTKYYFFSHSILSVVIPGLWLVVVLSYCFWVQERFLQPDKFTLTGSIYHTFITMITVGYGDTTPVTHTGRALSVFAGLMGVVMSSFVVAVVAAQLAVSPPEEYACNWVHRQQITDAERHAAAALLQHVFRGWRGGYHHPSVEKLQDTKFRTRHRRWQTHMMNIQKRFRGLRMREAQIAGRFRRSNPVLEQLQALNAKVEQLTMMNGGFDGGDMMDGDTSVNPDGSPRIGGRLLGTSMGFRRELASDVGPGWFYSAPTDRDDYGKSKVSEFLCKFFTYERHDGYEALCKFLELAGGAARERGIRLDFDCADYREVEVRLPIFTAERPVMTPDLPMAQLVNKIEFYSKQTGGVPNHKPPNVTESLIEYDAVGNRRRGSVRVGKARNIRLGVERR